MIPTCAYFFGGFDIPRKMRKDYPAQANSGDPVGTCPAKACQKRPNPNPDLGGIAHVLVDESETNNEAAIGYSCLAVLDECGQR
ncbi:MAG TPA: hypothetical protein VHU23_01470 [Rhizomicrobium sp.]|nr:hypothetical protein [Rhizomicrobium sp.]